MMDSKIQSNIKIEQPEVDLFTRESVTESQLFNTMDSEIKPVVKTEEPAVYLDYAEISSSRSDLSSTKQEHSETMMSHTTTDFRLVKQELASALYKDKKHIFNKISDMAINSSFQEMTGNSNIDPTTNESDYKVLFRLENCSEKVSALTEVNNNLSFINENSQSFTMETEVNDTHSSRGSLDSSLDSASSMCPSEQTSYLTDGSDPSCNVEKETHHAEKPYIQQVCSVTVTEADHVIGANNEEMLQNHDSCITSCKQRDVVRCQKRTHTGEKPYKCDVCGASYTKPDRLNHHRRIHTEEKPYKCVVCCAAFTTTSDLKKHRRTHTGKKPYQCDVCGAAFILNGSLN